MNFTFSSLLLSAAALGAANVLTAEAGAFTVAGQDLALPTYRLTCEVGKFKVTGRAFNQPIAAGSTVKIVTLGDSIMEYANGASSATRLDNQADGEIHWVKARGKAGFLHEVWHDPTAIWLIPSSKPFFNGANQGRAGDWATGVKRRLTAVINMNPDIVVLNIGTNNGGTGVDDNTAASAVIAELGLIVPQLAGVAKPDGSGIIRLVIGTVRPSHFTLTGTTGISSYEKSAPFAVRRDTINAYIRTLDNNSTIFVWDSDPDLLDPNPSFPLVAGSCYPWVVRDGIHLTPRGAFEGSRTLELTIDRILADGTWFDSDATTDNAITNGVLSGTGGTVGTGVSGQTPDSHGISNVSGASAFITAVSSVDSDGWHIALSSTGGGSSATNTQAIRCTSPSVSAAGQSWTSGTWIKLFAEVEVTGNAGLGALHLTLLQSSTIRAVGLGPTLQNRRTEPFAIGSRGGWIETHPQQVGAGTTFSARLDIEPYIDQAGDAVVTIKRWIMREVEDPHVTFPYDPMNPQVYSLAGQDVALNRSGSPLRPNLIAETGVFTAPAQDVAVRAAKLLIAGHGHFVALGGGRPLIDTSGAFLTDASGAVLFEEFDPLVFRAGRGVTLDAGAFALTGQDAVLVPQSPGIYAFAADPMALSLAGQDINLPRASVGELEAGSFALTGFDIEFFKLVPPLDAEAGIFTYSGQAAEFKRDLFAETLFLRVSANMDFAVVRRRVYIRFGPLLRRPGRIYPGTTVEFNGTFDDADGIPIDPLRTILRISSPSGRRVAQEYGVSGDIRRNSDGRYVCDVQLTEPGRWTYAWECLTADVWSIKEGSLLVMDSPFYSYPRLAYSE